MGPTRWHGFSKHATVDGNGVWIVSAHLPSCSPRDQAITALTVAELGESGARRLNTGIGQSPSTLEQRGAKIGAARTTAAHRRTKALAQPHLAG